MGSDGASSGTRRLRVAIDARIPADRWGGVQQVVQGLCSGLAGLDGAEEYLVLAFEDSAHWLDPVLGGSVRRVTVMRSSGRTTARRAYDALETRSSQATAVLGRLAAPVGPWLARVPRSDGSLERLEPDVVHFPSGGAFLTKVPSLYQPHDLLHIHAPETLSAMRRQYRDRAYRAFAAQARFVVVMTEWGRRDICEQFALPDSKVAVVPGAPVTGSVVGATGTGGQREDGPSVPDRFLIYPAQTWPHKNHAGLIRAIALLRDRGVRVPVVCTGRLNDSYGSIRRLVDELGVGDLVLFLGHVESGVLGDLLRRATALVFPSRLEGWGLPVVEAFAMGLPVVSSQATVLAEVAGGAALLFDADDPADIARAIELVWTDEQLRDELRDRGITRAASMSWDRAARTFRALYRRAANRTLTEEDRSLLAPPTLVST